MLRSICRSLRRPATVAASSQRRCLSDNWVSTSSQLFFSSQERHLLLSCRRRAPPPLHHISSSTASLSVSTPIRTLSTTTTQIPNSIETTSNSTTQNAKSTESSNESKNKSSSKKHPTDILLDNIGTIFLTAIFSIIALLVRSSFGTNNKNATRDTIETYSVLDPLEIDDLRVANSELTPEIMEEIMKDVWTTFPTGEATYEEFVSVVVQQMRLMKGDAFTVELGHLLDRVMIAALEEEEEEEEDGGMMVVSSESGVEKKVPLPLLFTVLSLALNGPVKERVRLLFNSLRQGKTDDGGDVARISRADATKMVSYLQRTCQLVPDAQVVEEDDAKYPVQQYRRGTAVELVARALNPDKKKKGDKVPDERTLSDRDRKDLEFDLNGFESLLYTRSVCAWGECYRKTKK